MSINKAGLSPRTPRRNGDMNGSQLKMNGDKLAIMNNEKSLMVPDVGGKPVLGSVASFSKKQAKNKHQVSPASPRDDAEVEVKIDVSICRYKDNGLMLRILEAIKVIKMEHTSILLKSISSQQSKMY